ncbi:MAG: heme NO-binding domain-containing protein [Pseudomonadota bacterium]
MHGLVNKGLERFLADTYGQATWAEIAAAAGLPPDGFEALLTYDLALTTNVLGVASSRLGKSEHALLEDLGTYLVSDPKMDSVRRLLRFGGIDFADFVSSLDELPERARLAVPNLNIPEVLVQELGPDEYRIKVVSDFGHFGVILAGILRAMADDYGCLSLIEWSSDAPAHETIHVQLLDGTYAEGKAFVLSAEAAP